MVTAGHIHAQSSFSLDVFVVSNPFPLPPPWAFRSQVPVESGYESSRFIEAAD